MVEGCVQKAHYFNKTNDVEPYVVVQVEAKYVNRATITLIPLVLFVLFYLGYPKYLLYETSSPKLFQMIEFLLYIPLISLLLSSSDSLSTTDLRSSITSEIVGTVQLAFAFDTIEIK